MNLNQTLIWTDKEGVDHLIREMPVGYKRNVVAFLEQRAARIAADYTLAELAFLSTPLPVVIGVDPDGNPVTSGTADLMPMGEMAQDAYEEELNERRRDPIGWLHNTPLVREMLWQIEHRIGEREK